MRETKGNRMEVYMGVQGRKEFQMVVAPLLNVRRGQGIIGVIKIHWGASSVSKGASHHTWQPTER